jgi:hypothetical protein
MFGVDNTGVINQRQSPAIWQSDITNFPANYILGRILIDTFQGGIYIDTASTRLQISAGNSQFFNGLTRYTGIPTTNNIGLGGDMNYGTQINLNGQSLLFEGATGSFRIDDNGVISDPANGESYFGTNRVELATVIPNFCLQFHDKINDEIFLVLAKRL